MKKFLLSLSLVFLLMNTYSQSAINCPIDKKRNNGNGLCTAGQFTFTFTTVPDSRLKVSRIYENNILRSDITAPDNPSINGTKATYCFMGGNLDPAATLKINFWIDSDNDGVVDQGEASIDCILPSQGSTLPVSLKSFNAVQRNGRALLSWETAQENNSNGFEIQRRIGNGIYETIGFTASKAPGGTGGAYSYSFDDNTSLTKGVTYYRLLLLDLDGKTAYSEIKAIRSGNSSITISVYPNPGRGGTNIVIPEGAGKMDVSLEDFSGKSIQRRNNVGVRNMQLTNLKPGIYMLRIHLQETGEQITEKIIIQ